MKEKVCAVEKKLSEKKSDMCLEVSLSINHYQYFGTSGFESFNLSASQERVVLMSFLFDISIPQQKVPRHKFPT